YGNERATLLYRELRERLNAAPGVKSAAFATVPILSGDEWDSSMSVEGHQAKDGEDMQAFMNGVSPGYFETMKIPLLEGRDFRVGDAKEMSDEKKQPAVAIVNRQFAEHFFPGKSALGKHIGFGDGPKSTMNIEIIGVVANSLYEGPREGVHRQVFLANWGKNSAAFYIRTQTPSDATYAMARNTVAQLAPSVWAATSPRSCTASSRTIRRSPRGPSCC